MVLDNPFLQKYAARKTAIRSIDQSALIPRQKRHALSIADVGDGGVIRFGHKTYRVAGVSYYKELNSKGKELGPKDTWPELTLFCLETGETSFLEWERDDEIEVFLSIRKLSFSDLRDDEGADIDEGDLKQIVNEEDSVFFDGVEYEYEDDYSANYKRGGVGRNQKGDRVSFLDFYSETKGLALTVEGWKSGDDTDYEVWLSRKMNPAEIEILSVGAGPKK